MKNRYETPKVIMHGTIEEMTQAFGSASAADTIVYGSFAFQGTGSSDGIVVPQ